MSDIVDQIKKIPSWLYFVITFVGTFYFYIPVEKPYELPENYEKWGYLIYVLGAATFCYKILQYLFFRSTNLIAFYRSRFKLKRLLNNLTFQEVVTLREFYILQTDVVDFLHENNVIRGLIHKNILIPVTMMNTKTIVFDKYCPFRLHSYVSKSLFKYIELPEETEDNIEKVKRERPYFSKTVNRGSYLY